MNAEVLEKVVDGLSNYASAVGDVEAGKLGAALYRQVSDVVDPAIGAAETCRLAFPTMLIRPDLRVECLVLVVADRVLVAWKAGAFRKPELQTIPIASITDVRRQTGSQAGVRGANLLVFDGSAPVTVALPLQAADRAATLVASAVLGAGSGAAAAGAAPSAPLYQPTGGYPTQPPTGFPTQPTGGFPTQPTSGLPTQPIGGFARQPLGDYPAQSAPGGGYAAPTAFPTGGYPQQPSYPPTSGYPGYDAGPGYAQPRRRPLPVLAVVIVVAVLGAAGYVLFRGTGQHGGTPSSQQSSAPNTGGSSQDAALIAAGQAAQITSVLAESATGRSYLGLAINDINSCSITSNTYANLQAAIDNRRTLLDRVGRLDLSAIPEGEYLRQLLTAALTASYDTDLAYLNWVQSAAGCPRSSDPAFGAVNDGNNRSGQTKTAFVNAWNPVAIRYGLPTTSRDSF